MKPKDLKYPFSWASRRPHFEDAVLFVPDYYDRHQEWHFPGFEVLFGNSRPVVIEYCAGNGTWIAEKAKNSSANWVAVECRFDRVRKIWSKAKNYQLSNLITVCGEAEIFTEAYLPSQSVTEAYINFPDPWPKEKHAKHRLFQLPFVEELARVVQKSVTVVTDDEPYARQIESEMVQSGMWRVSRYTTEWPDYGTSFFDTLWREKGRTIHYFTFERK
jgi:tRNA (guanine-N7-)-methyltransferase